MHDHLAGVDLDTPATADQFVGVAFAIEDLGEPVAQVCLFEREALVLANDLVLAPFQRMIELADDGDALGDEVARTQHLFGDGGKMHEHQRDAQIMRATLDLGEAIGC